MWKWHDTAVVWWVWYDTLWPNVVGFNPWIKRLLICQDLIGWSKVNEKRDVVQVKYRLFISDNCTWQRLFFRFISLLFLFLKYIVCEIYIWTCINQFYLYFRSHRNNGFVCFCLYLINILHIVLNQF